MSDWGLRKPFGLMDNWPKKEDGTTETPVLVGNIEAGPVSQEELTVNLLRAYGIPVLCAYPQDGSFGKTMLGASGYGTALYVPESMAEDAKNILRAEVVSEEEEQTT